MAHISSHMIFAVLSSQVSKEYIFVRPNTAQQRGTPQETYSLLERYFTDGKISQVYFLLTENSWRGLLKNLFGNHI